jgi:hypothetical protein
VYETLCLKERQESSFLKPELFFISGDYYIAGSDTACSNNAATFWFLKKLLRKRVTILKKCRYFIYTSWLDWAYKSSTCDIMYRRQRRHLYIMVVKFRNTIWPPPPQLSLHRRAALSSYSNGTRSVYSKREPKKQSILWDVYEVLRQEIISLIPGCILTLF